jgi:hypothetical protein
MTRGQDTPTSGAHALSPGRGSDPNPWMLPVPSDARRLAERLGAEEQGLIDQLAALEARVRRFADVERPAYASWRRLEFGPLLVTLQELSDELRMRRVLAHRVSDLALREGVHPREALHVLTHPDAHTARPAHGGFDPDEVEARRRAKRERKREQRRAAERTKRAAERPTGASGEARATRPARIVDLYRALARRLHPDSPRALRTVAPERLGTLWTDVQEAYESGGLERLLAIAAWIETLGDSDAGAPSGAGKTGSRTLLSFGERFDRLRVLRRSCRALERELAALHADPAWEFEEQHRDAPRELARRTRAGIEDDLDRVRRDLQEVDAFFDAIGRPRAPRSRRRRR